jgi:hypothetical protein
LPPAAVVGIAVGGQIGSERLKLRGCNCNHWVTSNAKCGAFRIA